MSQSLPHDNAMMPSALERKKIFYLLQKLSSVTAWRRILRFYKAWALVVENSVRVAQERGWGNETSLPHSEYVLVLKCLAHCEEGVRRLSKGDKRIFKFDANGEFAMAWRLPSHWADMMWRIGLGKNSIKEAQTPLWAEFNTTHKDLCLSWHECASEILQPRYLDEPALTFYGTWFRNELLIKPFPGNLAEVPDPVDNVFVRTNEWTPCSGIWEPIDTPKSPEPSLNNLFVRRPRPQPPFTITGTMNYLHGGSKAPPMNVETADDILKFDTTWRLLWRDDRYVDGTIPEEEAHYRFTEPQQVPPQSSIVNQEALRQRPENGDRTVANTLPVSVTGGGTCIVAGFYFTPVKTNSRRFFNQGDHFPDFTSSMGLPFWQWDMDQTESDDTR